MALDIYTPGASGTAINELKRKLLIYNPDEELKQNVITFKITDDFIDFINHVNIIGALLSYNSSTKVYTVWNGNYSYWNPFDTDNILPVSLYGDIVAVCVGKGLWAKINWNNNSNNEYAWSLATDVNYEITHGNLVHGNGADNTKHILNEGSYADITFWSLFESANNITQNDYYVYLPSSLEYLEMFNNLCDNKHKNTDFEKPVATPHTFTSNICKLLNISDTSKYWTSTQAASVTPLGKYAIMFNPEVYQLVVFDKQQPGRTIALIHF